MARVLCAVAADPLGTVAYREDIHMLEFDPTPTPTTSEETGNAQTTDDALTAVHAKLIGLLIERAKGPERYASLLSRARTGAAQELIARLCEEIERHEQSTGTRTRKRRAKGIARFSEGVERFVGDLLRVRAGNSCPGRIYHSLGKDDFADDPVKYDVFKRALDGLKVLGFVGHARGQSRYRTSAFDDKFKYKVPGHAARFWATAKLLGLAELHGITGSNVGDHFRPEPPSNPLVLKDFGTGHGRNRENGRIIRDYECTQEIERLAADVRELNAFLAGFEITGGQHDGYVRIFNNRAWDKGGRLYSIGGGYQLQPPEQRLQMKINGEAVAEIDITASHLTIYHSKIAGESLEIAGDPYARVKDIPRKVAKMWCVESLGNSSPKSKWSPGKAAEYLKETGRKLPKASIVAQKMLEAFPALKTLSDHPDTWADLQYIESEAVISAMLQLMRDNGVPSLAMHDGLIVPQSYVHLTKMILRVRYEYVVGVRPTLTVEPKEIEEHVRQLHPILHGPLKGVHVLAKGS